MTGIYEYEDTTGERTSTAIAFEYKDDKGHKLEILYEYRDNRRIGYLELRLVERKNKYITYGVMSELLREMYHGDYLSALIAFEGNEEPNATNAECVLGIAREILGAYIPEGLWRIPYYFRDINLYSGTFTDCHGNKYSVRNGLSVEVLTNEEPQPAEEFDDDIPF
jgi:hypothetical protein